MKIFAFVAMNSILIAGAAAFSIKEQQDYVVLERFFKMGIYEEEYGYVLEGLKPISIRNFTPLEDLIAYKDPVLFETEFENTLLTNKAISVWKRVCSKQKNFALKATPIESTSKTGWEIQFINLAKLKEIIDENIALFRYILGPTVQVDDLVHKLAYSEESFDSILNHNLVLIGIVLGYGTQNSVVGGRSETIFHRTIAKDCAPFQTKSQLMLSQKKHNMSAFKPEYYGGYYLEYAAGDDSHFREACEDLDPSPGFKSVEDELIAIDALNDDYPEQLRQKPAFVFNAFKGGPSNKVLFSRLIQTQKRIQNLLKRTDFLERVLEKISGEKPKITCKKPNRKNQKIDSDLSISEWTRILKAAASRFEEPEQQLAFFESYRQILPSCQKPPAMVGATPAMLAGLKIAIANLSASNSYFEKLSQDLTLQSIVPSKLYFKIIEPGQGKLFAGGGRVRIGYVVEDLNGHILYANHDHWLDLSRTISGFAHGVQNIHVGEKRILFIHPSYGYGALTTLSPCAGLIIKTQLIDFDEKTSGILPPLTPLDMDWIQDASYKADIESSLKQQPKYLGFLYRTLLDRVEGLNQSEIVALLSKICQPFHSIE